MLLVALTIPHFFYCSHTEAECCKWPRNNLRAILSLVLSVLLFERSHRNQAWPLAGVNGQVGRGQSVNLVTYDIVFFQCMNILNGSSGTMLPHWLQGSSILLCFYCACVKKCWKIAAILGRKSCRTVMTSSSSIIFSSTETPRTNHYQKEDTNHCHLDCPNSIFSLLMRYRYFSLEYWTDIISMQRIQTFITYFVV